MKTSRAAVCAASLGITVLGAPASAHRLDEYLQATTISVAQDGVEAQIRLTPGAAVFSAVLAGIDTDANKTLSEAEQRTYAQRVLHDLSLTLDGDPLRLQLVSWKFARTAEMREGRGEIQVDFSATVSSPRRSRKLTFENRHQSPISVYLVNCLVPTDPNIQVTAQTRNYEQSRYQLDYTQASVRSGLPSTAGWAGQRAGLAVAALLPLALPAWLWWLWRKRRTKPRAAAESRGE